MPLDLVPLVIFSFDKFRSYDGVVLFLLSQPPLYFFHSCSCLLYHTQLPHKPTGIPLINVVIKSGTDWKAVILICCTKLLKLLKRLGLFVCMYEQRQQKGPRKPLDAGPSCCWAIALTIELLYNEPFFLI